MAVLEAYLEAVEDGVKRLDPEDDAMLREQTGRLVRLSADAGALAQAEESHTAIDPRWVDTAELLTALKAFADRYAAKAVALHTEAGDTAPIWADRQRLTQVLGNLLDNALRHPAGGHVTLTTTRRGPEVAFTTTDDGDGIPAGHLPHVSNGSTGRLRPGPGSRRIGYRTGDRQGADQAHGGYTSAASRGPGQGTTFTVAVPVAFRARVSRRARNPRPPPPRAPHRRQSSRARHGDW